jgi:CheY-like chemotaxis protein
MPKRCSPQIFEIGFTPAAIRLCAVILSSVTTGSPGRFCRNGFSLNSHHKSFPPFPNLNRSFAPTNSTIAFWSQEASGNHSGFSSNVKAPIIYAVDDMPCLTELYALVLNKSGFVVRSFHDRQATLDSLAAAQIKPDLLITDLHNPTMRIEPFLEACVALHPTLRILMATGFGYHPAWCFSVTPHRFLPKPFTAEELRRAVEATLAGETMECFPCTQTRLVRTGHD